MGHKNYIVVIWSSCHAKSLGEILQWHPPKQSHCCPLSHSDGENLRVWWPVGVTHRIPWVFCVPCRVAFRQPKNMLYHVSSKMLVWFFIDLYRRKAHFLTWENRNPAWTKMWAVKTCQDIQELRCSSIQLGNQLPKAVHGFWTRRCTPWLKVKLAILLNQDHHRKIREFHP